MNDSDSDGHNSSSLFDDGRRGTKGMIEFLGNPTYHLLVLPYFQKSDLN